MSGGQGMSRREVVLAGLAAGAMVETAQAAPKAGQVLQDHDALGLAELVRKREVSALELLEAAIARAEALNPRLNFMAQKHYDYARAAIAKGLPQGPFTGVPWLLKDLNTYLAGTVTGEGSRYYTGEVAPVSSEIVRRYEAAGLVIFGKTTSPEFGLSPTTESAATGATRNPWNREHIAGGSSGGAASATAAGVLPAAHATDGGGSIRGPASCCGLFGMKPSRARNPVGPGKTEGWMGFSIGHAVTWSVRDSAALLDATQGPELGARYVAPPPERPFLEEVGRAPKGLRIAMRTTHPLGLPMNAECVAAIQAAGRLCESLGHHVEEAAPNIDYAGASLASGNIVAAEVAAKLLAREAETKIPLGPDVLDITTLLVLAQGRNVTGIDIARANATLQKAAIGIAEFMQNYDVLLTTTLGAPAPRIGTLKPNMDDLPGYGRLMGAYASPPGIYNQTGQPSMSVPLAMSKDGLPIGLMFTARYGDEATLFRLAGQLEQAAPWRGRRPKL